MVGHQTYDQQVVSLTSSRALHCWVSTWMGDRLWAVKPFRHVTSHVCQLSLPSIHGRLFKYRPVCLVLRWSVFTCVGWQVTLCDPIWQVTLCSSEMEFHQQLCTTFLPFVDTYSCGLECRRGTSLRAERTSRVGLSCRLFLIKRSSGRLESAIHFTDSSFDLPFRRWSTSRVHRHLAWQER